MTSPGRRRRWVLEQGEVVASRVVEAVSRHLDESCTLRGGRLAALLVRALSDVSGARRRKAGCGTGHKFRSSCPNRPESPGNDGDLSAAHLGQESARFRSTMRFRRFPRHACHAEGRGFESLHPLPKPPVFGGFCFLGGDMCPRFRREAALSRAHGLAPGNTPDRPNVLAIRTSALGESSRGGLARRGSSPRAVTPGTRRRRESQIAGLATRFDRGGRCRPRNRVRPTLAASRGVHSRGGGARRRCDDPHPREA